MKCPNCQHEWDATIRTTCSSAKCDAPIAYRCESWRVNTPRAVYLRCGKHILGNAGLVIRLKDGKKFATVATIHAESQRVIHAQ